MTRVEECTRALTGVGAAIAAGSHLEKGIWALLVIPASIIQMMVYFIEGLLSIFKMNQCPCWRVSAMAIRIITSPTRFVRAVMSPAPSLLGF